MKLTDALARNPGLGLVVGGVLVVGLVWFLFRDKVAAAAQAINPASDQNLAYRGVNAVGAAATGDDSFSFGSWLYDLSYKARLENARIAAERKSPDERTWFENLITPIRGG